jgi:hypothetical protein
MVSHPFDVLGLYAVAAVYQLGIPIGVKGLWVEVRWRDPSAAVCWRRICRRRTGVSVGGGGTGVSVGLGIGNGLAAGQVFRWC